MRGDKLSQFTDREIMVRVAGQLKDLAFKIDIWFSESGVQDDGTQLSDEYGIASFSQSTLFSLRERTSVVESMCSTATIEELARAIEDDDFVANKFSDSADASYDLE
jgi:hypothetical protein